MIFTALLIGIITTILGALPPGASNLAVIKTSLNESQHESLKISYGAGLGEVLLAFIAFSSGMVVQDFFEMNLWVQYLVATILAMAGLYFILKKKDYPKRKRQKSSKYLLGFTLSIINPPVLVYWILVFSLLGKWLSSTASDSTLWLALFLSGVFIGKVATLYGYSRFGSHIQKKKSSSESSINRYIGVTLIILACMQVIKLTFI
ncbi:LysE family transporter [Dokdonia sp. PRO95]|uniref:LysE family transporter n=1 Tax=Dokdonia sp. PRO95 TaxID=1239415 RepID=UPI000556D3A9|nr:LysE family transporter [Dokdonia sp. PRO95]